MKKAVLAVDDSKTVLNMIELYLKEEYDVFLATSGDQALQLLQKRSVDMILLDIVMPVMNGLIVLRKIREMEGRSDIPVLFLTGDAHRATVVESFQTGSQGYILKPVTKENLIQRIEEGMRKQKERLLMKEEEKRLQAEREEEQRRNDAKKAEEEENGRKQNRKICQRIQNRKKKKKLW